MFFFFIKKSLILELVTTLLEVVCLRGCVCVWRQTQAQPVWFPQNTVYCVWGIHIYLTKTQVCGKQLSAAFCKPTDDAFSGKFHCSLKMNSGERNSPTLNWTFTVEFNFTVHVNSGVWFRSNRVWSKAKCIEPDPTQ
jgi:hypothetical protein